MIPTITKKTDIETEKLFSWHIIMLALRLTMGGKVNPDSVSDFFKSDKCLIASEHEETNHHYHISLKPTFDITTATVDAYRKKMNRHFKCVPNQSYCRVDQGKYAIYTVKCDNIISNNLYTASELEGLKEKSYIKKQRKSLVAEAVDSFTPTRTEFFDSDMCPDVRYEDFDDEMFDHWVDQWGGKPFGLKHCQEYVFGCMGKYEPKRLIKILKKKILY